MVAAFHIVASTREAVLGKSAAPNRAKAATVHPSDSRRSGGRKARAGAATLGAASPSGGVRVIPVRHGGVVVYEAEMQQAILGLRQLPAADIALLAENGIQIELVPVAALEGGLVGATRIVQRGNGPWTPVRIQVAVRHKLGGDRSISEIVQHEVGHAVSVLRFQDRSEAAAEAYAQRY